MSSFFAVTGAASRDQSFRTLDVTRTVDLQEQLDTTQEKLNQAKAEVDKYWEKVGISLYIEMAFAILSLQSFTRICNVVILSLI